MKRNTWISGLILGAAALSLLRRYGLHAGAAPAERKQTLPGDEVVPHPDLEITNAISIGAPAEAVWPWLVQMGYYRGGWFTDSTWKDWDYLPDKVMRYFVREEAQRSGYGHREAHTSVFFFRNRSARMPGLVSAVNSPGAFFSRQLMKHKRDCLCGRAVPLDRGGIGSLSIR